MLPEVSELNQDILNNELNKWYVQRARLYDFPLGSFINFWGIHLCNYIIREIERKLEAIEYFLGATQGLYEAANGVGTVLQQTRANMGKISYNTHDRYYNLKEIDSEWLCYIAAYAEYRRKLDRLWEVYDRLNPRNSTGEVDWKNVDWDLWIELLERVHLEDLEKFNLTEEEVIAVTMILDELQENIWKFVEEAEKFGANIKSLLPFGNEVIGNLEKGGKAVINVLNEPWFEAKIWNLLNGSGEITRLLGFAYTGKKDDYYITKKGSLQSKFGFMDFFDDAGKLLGMDLDEEIVTFVYGGKEYRIELWKGNYGFGNAYGGEFGIYYRDASEAIANPYVKGSQQSRYTLYHCMTDDEQFRTVQYIYDKDNPTQPVLINDTQAYEKDGHFWNLAIQTDPGYTKKDLYSIHRLYIEDEGMLQATCEAFLEQGTYAEIKNENGSQYLEVLWGK